MKNFRRGDLYVAGAIALTACLVLLVLALVYPIQEFYVTRNALMSNDQVGYITTARWLADTGELRSHLIYPAHVREPRWRLYMPGTYYVLAASHVLFGAGAIAWRIPAMLSFVLAAVGVFFIGRRFYGRAEGVVAAVLFMLFPPMAAFAFTAMTQLPFIAAGVSAFCVFAYLPARLRAYLVPLLLVGPFLFRETGALLIIPMVLVVLGERQRRRWSTLLAVVLGSVLMLYGLLEWQLASGKASLPLHVVGGFNYANAFPPSLPPPTIDSLLAGRAANVSSNLDALRSHLDRRDGVTLSFAVLLVFAVLATVRGTRRDPPGNRDWLALGAGLLAFAAASMITALHTWYLYRGLRAVLFTFPLLAVSVAPWLVSVVQWLQRGIRLPRPAGVLLALGALGMLLGGAWWGTQSLVPGFDPTAGRQTVGFMKSLGLERGGLLVAPGDVALDYVLRHYPLRFSFVPKNRRTLRLLAERHHVQTLMVATNTRQGSSPRYLEAIRDLGLVRVKELPHPLQPGVTLLLFERPRY